MIHPEVPEHQAFTLNSIDSSFQDLGGLGSILFSIIPILNPYNAFNHLRKLWQAKTLAPKACNSSRRAAAPQARDLHAFSLRWGLEGCWFLGALGLGFLVCGGWFRVWGLGFRV